MKAEIEFVLMEGTPEDCDPKYKDPEDSGFEVYLLDDLVLYPFVPTLVGHGVRMAVEPGFDLQLRPRSSSLPTDHVHIQLGTIDNGYRGELKTVVTYIPPLGKLLSLEPAVRASGSSLSDVQALSDRLFRLESALLEPLHIPALRENAKTGKVERTRLCQVVVSQHVKARFNKQDELSTTQRGAGGFGSTGG